MLIVDEDPLARVRLHSLLVRDPGVEVAGECASLDEAVHALRAEAPDLVFAGATLQGRDALEALARGADAERLPPLVVMSGDEAAAARAFQARAAAFLLKPCTEPRLRDCLRHVRGLVREKRLARLGRRMLRAIAGGAAPRPAPSAPALAGDSPRFVCRLPGRVVIVTAGDVEWVEAERDYVRLHTRDHAYLLRETMGRMEEQLEPEGFVRIHRSCLVRLNDIREVRAARGEPGRWFVVLRSGKQCPISESGRKRLEGLLGVTF
ncbi:MAG TPA: LytTR family DNA-binding domain-containing protein [Longimicrobium sp.]|nr:LytTR family DNA-binding domain-containing protein [Longimicrobium sp.]